MKVVNESLLEFQKGLDPVDSLGLGRRAQIKEWLDFYQIKDYFINDDNIIDVYGDVIISHLKIVEFPEFIQFGKITGTFSCSNNKLSSLRGCPYWVGRDFGCRKNNLSSLEYAPKYVGDEFFCQYNPGEFTDEDVHKICKVKNKVHSTYTKY